MAQLALATLVLAIVSLFAVLSWRAGQKPAALAFAALGLLLAGIFLYSGYRAMRAPPELDPRVLAIELDSVNVTGAGWRLTGHVSNNGDVPVSSVVVRAIVSDCGEMPCRVLDDTTFTLLFNIPAGQRYPFRQALHDINLDPAVTEPSWSLEIMSVVGYPAAIR